MAGAGVGQGQRRVQRRSGASWALLCEQALHKGKARGKGRDEGRGALGSFWKQQVLETEGTSRAGWAGAS